MTIVCIQWYPGAGISTIAWKAEGKKGRFISHCNHFEEDEDIIFLGALFGEQ
jgi:hypothetical protein